MDKVNPKHPLVKELSEFSRKNPSIYQPTVLAREYVRATPNCPQTVRTVRGYATFVLSQVKPEQPVTLYERVKNDVESHRVKIQDSESRKMYEAIKAQYVALSDQMADMLQLGKLNLEVQELARTEEKYTKAVPFVQWSDWHCGKIVNPETVLGLNTYNADVCVTRTNKLFENTVRNLRLYRNLAPISSAVIHLGGDFIEGYLREESMQENVMSPIEEVIFATQRIVSGIHYVRNHAPFIKRLYLLCNRGNHSRITRKMQSNDHRMNYETLVYYMVQQSINSDPAVQMLHPESELGSFEILNKTIRFLHGNQIKYNGGIGGLTIPLRKAILNWDTTKTADYTLMSHFHMSYKPLSNVMLNGSVCGYDPFAMNVVKAAFQEPMQSMELLVKDVGFRMFTSVDCK